MAVHRGIQSVIFFYLSCAPCADVRYRKKLKRDAARGRADRDALEAEMPGVYRHPSPSSTNPHWQAEIAAGPTLASRGRKKNTANANGGSGRGLKTSMTQRSDASGVPSSVDLSLPSRDGRNDSKFDFKRYQREDEEPPWESNGSAERLAGKRMLDGSVIGGESGITRPPRAHIGQRSYTGLGNPQINDLHPATVTKIGSREEARWLMQPPPTAEVMSGKQRAPPRSRSGSGGSSRLSARSGVPLSREMSARMIEHKLRSGDLPPLTPTLSRESTLLVPTSNDLKGQRHDRSSTTGTWDFAHLEESSSSRKEKRRPSPIQIQVSQDSNESATTVIHNPDAAPTSLWTRRIASKPQLSTIASDSLLPAYVDDALNFAKPKENRRSISGDQSQERQRAARRSALTTKDDSLKILHDLAPASALFKTTHLVSAQRERRPRRLSQDASAGDERPELYDSWYTPDFALDDWVHEHTKREGVRERWSMDI